MTITEAREYLRRAVRIGTDDSQWNDADIDRAIQKAGRRFCRVTKAIKAVANLSLVTDAPAVDITAAIAAGFTAERLLDICVFDPPKPDPLVMIDYPALISRRATSDASGIPRFIAFVGDGTAEVYPTPSQAFTAKLRFWQDFTTWEPGAEATDELNVPTDLMDQIIDEGATGYLRISSPDHAQAANESIKQFETWLQQMRGVNNLGPKVIFLEKQGRTTARPADRIVYGQ